MAINILFLVVDLFIVKRTNKQTKKSSSILENGYAVFIAHTFLTFEVPRADQRQTSPFNL